MEVVWEASASGMIWRFLIVCFGRPLSSVSAKNGIESMQSVRLTESWRTSPTCEAMRIALLLLGGHLVFENLSEGTGF